MNGAPDGGSDVALDMPSALDATPEQVQDAPQIDAPMRACMKLSGPMDVNTGDALYRKGRRRRPSPPC